MDASVSECVCGGLTCRCPASMSDNQQRHGPTTTVARLTACLLFSLHETRTSPGHLHDRCSWISHPPATCSVVCLHVLPV